MVQERDQTDRERRQQKQRRQRRADRRLREASRQSEVHGRTSTSPALEPGEDFERIRHVRPRQLAPALHRHVDRGPVVRADARIVDAEAGDDERARHDERRALAGRYPHADALADEIIAETGDRRVGDDAAVLDLRIDQPDGAELRAALADLFAVDAHRIARLEKAGMPLRHAQPQARNSVPQWWRSVSPGRMTVPVGHRHLQDAAGGRRQHLALGELLLDHRALGGARTSAHWSRHRRRCALRRGWPSEWCRVRTGLPRAVRSVCALASCASSPAIWASSDFICNASFSSPTVATTWPCSTSSPSLTASCDHRAADARSRRDHVGALDRGEHRLFVGQRLRRDDEAVLRERPLRQQREHSRYDKSATHDFTSSCTRRLRRRSLICANSAPASLASRRRAVDAIERADEFARLRAADRIPDGLPVAPRRHQPVLAQQREMLRHGRIADFQELRQVRRPSVPSRSADRR